MHERTDATVEAASAATDVSTGIETTAADVDEVGAPSPEGTAATEATTGSDDRDAPGPDPARPPPGASRTGAGLAAGTAPPPASVGLPTVDAPRPRSEPSLDRRMKSAERTAISGYVFLTAGGATILFVSLPALLMAARAEIAAELNSLVQPQDELYERAERRREVAKISFWSGVGALGVGAVLVAGGLGSKAHLRRARERLSAAPVVGRDRWGLALSIRR